MNKKKMKIKIFVLWEIVLQNDAKRDHIAFQRFIIHSTIETQHAKRVVEIVRHNNSSYAQQFNGEICIPVAGILLRVVDFVVALLFSLSLPCTPLCPTFYLPFAIFIGINENCDRLFFCSLLFPTFRLVRVEWCHELNSQPEEKHLNATRLATASSKWHIPFGFNETSGSLPPIHLGHMPSVFAWSYRGKICERQRKRSYKWHALYSSSSSLYWLVEMFGKYFCLNLWIFDQAGFKWMEDFQLKRLSKSTHAQHAHMPNHTFDFPMRKQNCEY